LDALHSIALHADAAWSFLPKALQKGQVSAVAAYGAKDLLQAQIKLCHDLWAVKLGAMPRFFEPPDLPKPPPARALAVWGDQLNQLAKRIDHPFKPELLIEDMVQQAKLCINSRL
jgi:DNA polymerase-3 subunit delta'